VNPLADLTEVTQLPFKSTESLFFEKAQLLEKIPPPVMSHLAELLLPES
jgi:hypothetical protein